MVLAALAAIVVVCLSACGGSSKPISVAITASSATVDGADTVTLTATVSHDKNAAGVSWTVTSGGGKLSNTTTTSATYTAPAATNSQQTVTITATSVANSAQTGDITITVPAAPTVMSTSANLAGSVGTTYSITLQASGGIAPYTWALANGAILPTCLTLNSSGVITTTSGTAPTAACAGTYSNLTFTVTDSGKPNPLTATSAPLTITIAAAPVITFTGNVPTTGTYGVPFAGSAGATGGAGALTYSISAGALPPDLGLIASTGAIRGTPNKATDVGVFNFTVKAYDGYGDSATQSYTLTISYAAMSVMTRSLPTAYVAGLYTQSTLSATGGTGVSTNYQWQLTGGTSLPGGLALSTAGVISGTLLNTDTTGTYNFTVKVTDTVANISGTGNFSIVVDPGVSITTNALFTGYVGSNYSVQLKASGGTGTGYQWIVTGGTNLPSGLTLSLGGLLSGRPTNPGTTTLTFNVVDSVGNSATVTLSLTIKPGITVTPPANLPAAYPGTAYTPSGPFTASGGSGTGYTFTWAAAAGSTLPNGLSISSTGVVSGTPVNSGTSTVTSHVVITATDSVGNTASIEVVIFVEATLTVSSPATLPGVLVGVNPNYGLTATGGSGTYTSWTVNAAGVTSLQNVGLAVSANGVLVGANPTAGTANFSVTVTDTEGHVSAPAALSVTVSNSVTITTASLNALDVGQAASQMLTAAGGSGNSANYSWSWAAGAGSSIPAGLSLSTAGAITGTPTTAGTYTVAVTVKDNGVTPNQTYSQNFNITINSALTLPASNSLPGGYVGVSYTGSIAASGGSGNYCWTVPTAAQRAGGGGLPDGLAVPLPNVPGNTCNYVSSSLPISGTPTNPPTPPYAATFAETVTDTTTGASVGRLYSVSITAPAAPSLPPFSSSVPGPAINGQPYTGSITATGGVGPMYTWTVNGTTVPTTGSLALGASGLASQFSVSNSGGGATLSISGNPTSLGTFNFTAQIKDNTTGLSSFLLTYVIQVRAPGQNISGQISLEAECGGTTTTNLPTFQVSLNTSPVMTTTTDSSGNYSFTNVPNGTWVITPSIAGPGSAFYNVPPNITMNGGDITNLNFVASLGYSVSGSVSYTGAVQGRVYLLLLNYTCPGGDGNGSTTYGTSISAPGSFTIHGVAPGTYTLRGLMDPSTLGEGQPNAADPKGRIASSIFTVSNADVTGENITLSDPTGITVGNGPTLFAVSPEDSAAVISFGNVGIGGGDEQYTSYTVQWSTTTTGFSSTNQATFKATGANGGNVWILDAADKSTIFKGSLANGTAYYFRAMGTNAAGNSPWSYWDGSGTACALTTCAATVTIGAPSEPDTVSGTVTIPAGITIHTGAVLYAGLYDDVTNTAYAVAITSPVSGANAYMVNVPNGSNYVLFGILDQNADGVIDTGDDTNVNTSNSTTIAISGTTSGEDVTLPSTNVISEVDTLFLHQIEPAGVVNSHSLTLALREGNKLPVAVELTSGPNMVTPVDLCRGCISTHYEYQAGVFGNPVHPTDAYVFTVTYSDGSQETNVTASPTTFGTTGGIVNMPATAASLAPSGTSSTSTTPTFTWVDPTVPGASTYGYSFAICCDTSGNLIWTIPGSGSNSNGFGSSITSITWGTDPTGNATNVPTVANLTPGTTYYWSINVQDDKGNVAETSTWYQP